MAKLSKSNLKKTLYYLKRNGLRDTYLAALERLRKKEDYRYEAPTEAVLRAQKEEASRMAPLLFSILVPTYRTPENYLRKMIDSVLAQTYGNFELILADASGDESVKQVVDTYEDKRIRYIRLTENKGISGNTNEALMHATGLYTGLLDHDDLLTPDALYENAMAIAEAKSRGIRLQLLYSDEDKCDESGENYFCPHKKEEFNLDLILSNNYICHFTVMETALLKELHFRKEYDGAQDFDLVLRAVGSIYDKCGQSVFAAGCPGKADPAENIFHIARVLYHWRCHSASTADNPQSKQYAYEAGRNAVRDFLKEQGVTAGVAHSKHLGFYEINYHPDFLSLRKDVGAIGRPAYKNNKITYGMYDENGKNPYQGLKKGYAGEMNRAELVQDVYAVDIRTMKVRKELRELVQNVLKEQTSGDTAGVLVGGFVVKENGTFESRKNFTEEEYAEISRKVCEAVKKEGYRIVYLPGGWKG